MNLFPVDGPFGKACLGSIGKLLYVPLISLCNDVRAFGVPGVWTTSPCGQRSISQVLRIGMFGSVTGLGVSVSTLSGLKGYSL